MGQTWTYSGDPANSSIDAVRLLVGQTSTGDDVLVYDQELTWIISQQPTTYYAAAMAARTLAARYRATQPEGEGYGQTRLDWGDRAKKLDALADRLQGQGAMQAVAPFVGGASRSDIATRQADTDRTADAFTVGGYDMPGLWESSTSST